MMQVNFLHESSGVWVLPTRKIAAVYGQRLCLLFSEVSISAEHHASAFSKAESIFIFTFFKQAPVFLAENVRCKVKGILGMRTINRQKIVRCSLRRRISNG